MVAWKDALFVIPLDIEWRRKIWNVLKGEIWCRHSQYTYFCEGRVSGYQWKVCIHLLAAWVTQPFICENAWSRPLRSMKACHWLRKWRILPIRTASRLLIRFLTFSARCTHAVSKTVDPMRWCREQKHPTLILQALSQRPGHVSPITTCSYTSLFASPSVSLRQLSSPKTRSATHATSPARPYLPVGIRFGQWVKDEAVRNVTRLTDATLPYDWTFVIGPTCLITKTIHQQPLKTRSVKREAHLNAIKNSDASQSLLNSSFQNLF